MESVRFDASVAAGSGANGGQGDERASTGAGGAGDEEKHGRSSASADTTASSSDDGGSAAPASAGSRSHRRGTSRAERTASISAASISCQVFGRYLE